MVHRLNYSWFFVAATMIAIMVIFSLLIKDLKEYIQKMNHDRVTTYLQVD